MANISSVNGNPIVVGASGISDGAVTAAKIASNAVTTEKLASGAVTTSDLAASAVTTAKIADGAITDEKLDSNGLIGVVTGSTVTGKNKFDPVHITDHASIDSTDGSVYTVTPNSSVSSLIEVGQETHVITSYTSSSGSTTVISIATMQTAFYDESQEFISLESGSGSVNVPSGAAYMRVTIPSTYAPALARVMVEFGAVLTGFEPYKQTIRGDLDVIASNHESRISALEGAIGTASDLVCGIVNGTFSQIKLIGDSITQGVGGTGFNPNGSPATDYSDNSTYYGDGAVTCIDQRKSATIKFRVNDAGVCWANSFKDYIESKFDGVTVKNYGTRGLAAIHMITHGYRDEQSQFHSLIEQLIEPEDDFVICMFGTNDRKAVESYPPYDSSVYRDYMQQIIDYVTGLGKTIAIMACIPASASAESTVSVHMDDINREVCYLAKTNGLQSVSLYNLMNQYIRYAGVELSELLSDTLHPNDTGYDLMYRMVLEGFGFGSPYVAVSSE